MTHHPKERPGYLSRRDFLARAAGTGFAISGAGSLLAACSSSTTVAQETGTAGELLGPGGLPLARPDKRVSLPLWEDPIESGLEPETGGTFTVFNYPDYLYKKLLKEFGEPSTASTSSTRRSTTSRPGSRGSPPAPWRRTSWR